MGDEIDLLNEFENEKRYSFFKKYWINLSGIVFDFFIILFYNGRETHMVVYGVFFAIIAVGVLFNKLYEQDQKSNQLKPKIK